MSNLISHYGFDTVDTYESAAAGRPDYSERAITLAESDMRDHESF